LTALIGQAKDRILVFDLDDTLYMERDFARSGLKAVGDWSRSALGVDGFFETAWRLFRESPRADLFDVTLERLGVEVAATTVRRMVDVYRDHRPTIDLLPDAVRFLAKRGAYAGFAIVTDGFQNTQQRKIDALGVAAFCDPIIKTDQWGRDYWKPHARAFLTIQERYDRPGGAFTYIGDNPQKDFVAPKSLGWHTVRVRREGGLHARREAASETAEAARTITSLDQLAEALG